ALSHCSRIRGNGDELVIGGRDPQSIWERSWTRRTDSGCAMPAPALRCKAVGHLDERWDTALNLVDATPSVALRK
ncbi:MAG: hypothetical protein ACREXR_05340, partial [Gammaproteobacteria bacterium]